MRLRNAAATGNWRRPRLDLGLQASRAVNDDISAALEPQGWGHLSWPQDTDRGGDAVEGGKCCRVGASLTPLPIITLVAPLVQYWGAVPGFPLGPRRGATEV